MTTWMMLVIAGPNGSGKTTATTKVVKAFGEKLLKLNADDRTLQLKNAYPEKSPLELNLLAAQQIDAEVEQNIKEGKSFYVETVLSSTKYQDDVIAAKAKGYHFALVYVTVYPPKVSAMRVKVRAAKGGHDVETQKVIDRYYRSHKNLEWFAAQADTFLILDNTELGKPAILLAEKMAGQEITHHVKGINPEVDRVVGVLQKKQAPTSPTL